MKVRPQLPLAELERLERMEKDAAHSKRLRIIILAIHGFTAPAVAMSVGLAPVKGITLPLMSYGGSSIIAALAAFGLVLNVRMRRFTN